MRVLVAGATGFIGTELCRQLEGDGHSVLRLTRGEPRTPGEFRWSPRERTIDARAIGERLTERSAKGTGFLSDVVEAWETAARLAPEPTRVVTFRTGLVVGRGGAFTPLIPLTRFGLAARMGTGRQHWPWVALFDEAAAIRHLLTSSLSGAVNIVGPEPATSAEVTRALAEALGRWHPLVVPEFALRMLGDAGKDLLLSSELVVPERLTADGFEFRYPSLRAAMAALAA